MTRKSDAKFQEKLTRGSEKDIGIWQIFSRALECLENWDFNGILLSKVENV